MSAASSSVDIHGVPGIEVVDELTTALIKMIDAYSDSKQKIDFSSRLHPVDREKTAMKKWPDKSQLLVTCILVACQL